jgi:benzoyl-CoA-dihydrodiol lyase
VTIQFECDPLRYRHWAVSYEGRVAMVTLRVDPAGGLGDYELKLNSYDLSVDIELADIVQRMRLEHPEVKAVVLTGGIDKVFSAGANIQMLAGASHHDKVNFCRFTNETRNAIEDATDNSSQIWLAAINGTAAGGGYELALACDEIMLVDDRSSAVSLPEVPMLGVLPGTGGLTRLVDKRHVRRDLADVFATRVEGARGAQALEWGLVDSVAPKSSFDEHVRTRAQARAATSDRPDPPDDACAGVELRPLEPAVGTDTVRYKYVDVVIDRDSRSARLAVRVPEFAERSWMLEAARQLDDAVLRLRFHEPTIGTWLLQTRGEPAHVLAADRDVRPGGDGADWLKREIRLYWKRVLKRLDVSARTLIALVDPGSCFAGTLAELALASDRTLMLDGPDSSGGKPAAICLSDANDSWYPMGNGLTRLRSRFWGRDDLLAEVQARFGADLSGGDALALGLVTSAPDDIDWEDEVRLLVEERASFSPDALTGMEANFRFVGPETVETKIFGRLTAWQNWVFQRANAAGPDGALRRYGTGSRPDFDRRRV